MAPADGTAPGSDPWLGVPGEEAGGTEAGGEGAVGAFGTFGVAGTPGAGGGEGRDGGFGTVTGTGTGGAGMLTDGSETVGTGT